MQHAVCRTPYAPLEAISASSASTWSRELPVLTTPTLKPSSFDGVVVADRCEMWATHPTGVTVCEMKHLYPPCLPTHPGAGEPCCPPRRTNRCTYLTEPGRGDGSVVVHAVVDKDGQEHAAVMVVDGAAHQHVANAHSFRLEAARGARVDQQVRLERLCGWMMRYTK
jgi:hypothetical protein